MYRPTPSEVKARYEKLTEQIHELQDRLYDIEVFSGKTEEFKRLRRKLYRLQRDRRTTRSCYPVYYFD